MIDLLVFGLAPIIWPILAALAGGFIGFTIGNILAMIVLGWGSSDFRATGVGFLGLLLGAVAGLLIWRVASGGPIGSWIGPLIGPLIGFLVGLIGVLILFPAGLVSGSWVGRMVGSKVVAKGLAESIGAVTGALAGIAIGVGLGVGASRILG